MTTCITIMQVPYSMSKEIGNQASTQNTDWSILYCTRTELLKYIHCMMRTMYVLLLYCIITYCIEFKFSVSCLACVYQ